MILQTTSKILIMHTIKTMKKYIRIRIAELIVKKSIEELQTAKKITLLIIKILLINFGAIRVGVTIVILKITKPNMEKEV